MKNTMQLEGLHMLTTRKPSWLNSRYPYLYSHETVNRCTITLGVCSFGHKMRLPVFQKCGVSMAMNPYKPEELPTCTAEQLFILTHFWLGEWLDTFAKCQHVFTNPQCTHIQCFERKSLLNRPVNMLPSWCGVHIYTAPRRPLLFQRAKTEKFACQRLLGVRMAASANSHIWAKQRWHSTEVCFGACIFGAPSRE